MSLLKIDFDFPSLERNLRKHQSEANLLVMATVQTNRGMLFDQEGKMNGHKVWDKLKMRDGQILSRRGVLRKSIAPFNAKGTPGPQGIAKTTGFLKADVGTKVKYASTQNNGAIIKAKPGKVLSFINEISGKRVYTHSVNIPARNFSDWNDRDQAELDNTMAAFILEKALG